MSKGVNVNRGEPNNWKMLARAPPLWMGGAWLTRRNRSLPNMCTVPNVVVLR